MTPERKLIGELNGKWASLFKISLVVTPLFISLVVTWGAWATQAVYGHDSRLAKLEGFAGEGERFTKSQADKMRAELQSEWLKEISEIRRQIDTLPQTLQIPPPWWEQYVREEFNRMNRRIDVHEGKEKP
jgi:hypothetical protein